MKGGDFVARKKAPTKSTEELDQLRELVTESDSENQSQNGSSKHSRRGLLKMAGAALAGAAGAAAMRAVPAAAATGSAVLQGCFNIPNSDNPTYLVMGGVATPLSGNGTAWIARGANAMKGAGYFVTDHSQEIGVFGQSKGVNGNGTDATSTGTGVMGVSFAGRGVEGDSSTGIGGHFLSTSGYDALLGAATAGTSVGPSFFGSGRLAMVGRTDVGGSAPNITPFFVTHSTLFAGGHFQHELVRGNDGSIWASTASMAGTNQSRWKRVNAVRTDAADGLGGFFKPVRVMDTRLLGGPKAANAAYHVPVAGLGSGASTIPGDAIAVMGNLTAVNYSGAGFMTVMPDLIPIGSGAGNYNPASDPSSVNFILGQAAIANSFVSGLNGGKLQVYIAVSGSHFIIDITAYLQ
jgi:hypothetical protein